MPLFNEKSKSAIFNLAGWHTARKIIVFESDDWGSLRIPSREALSKLSALGYQADKTPFALDCLESEGDISSLAEVLSSVSNGRGENPVFTLNNIVANPDFKKIKESGFSQYFFEPFTETYRKYPNHEKSPGLIREGIEKRLFKPQLHGREHLNVNRWMDLLKAGDSEVKGLFGLSITGLPDRLSKEGHRSFQRAFDYDKAEERAESARLIKDACNIFQQTWNYRALSFVAPNFFWDDTIEKSLHENGIKYIQGQRAQFISDYKGGYRAKYHFTGQKNRLGQVYLVRNALFEPSFDKNRDWVDTCMKEISMAFKLRKPAIISSHRVNYIGSIDPANRDRGLRSLGRLLSEITRRWPEAEFISSDVLGDMISGKQK